MITELLKEFIKRGKGLGATHCGIRFHSCKDCNLEEHICNHILNKHLFYCLGKQAQGICKRNKE